MIFFSKSIGPSCTHALWRCFSQLETCALFCSPQREKSTRVHFKNSSSKNHSNEILFQCRGRPVVNGNQKTRTLFSVVARLDDHLEYVPDGEQNSPPVVLSPFALPPPFAGRRCKVCCGVNFVSWSLISEIVQSCISSRPFQVAREP